MTQTEPAGRPTTRMGLVGAGPWAGLFHGPMIAESPDLELTAVWARRPEAAADVTARFGGTIAGSLDALFDACDAVAFCVPPDVQARIAVDAAQAGKHLLLEKPVALDVPAAERVAAAVDAAGVVTQLVLTNRYTAPVQAFLDALGDDVLLIDAQFVCASALEGSHFATPWRREPGAAVFDLGPHVLDLMIAAGGAVTELRAESRGGVVAIASRHASGALGQARLSLTTPGTDGPLVASAITSEGRVVLDDPMGAGDVAVRRAVADAFVAALAAGSTELDVHRGVMLQRVLAAVRTSLAEEQAVAVDG